MAKPIYGDLELKGQQTLRFADSDSSNVVSLGAPATVASDLALVLPSSDTSNGALVSDGSGNLSLSLIANANIDASAAIAQSKLDLAITNAEVDAAAAIAQSKLDLAITDSEVAAGAAIAVNKLAALTADRALISDGSGFLSASAVTATELGYLDGVTSAIQTQLDGKAGTALDNLSVTSLAAESLLVGAGTDSVAALGVGTDGQVLKVVSGQVAWAADAGASTFAADWITADGTTKVVNHALATQDVIVQLYDQATDETILIDSVVRTDANNVTLTASEAPNASGWRVLIIAV